MSNYKAFTVSGEACIEAGIVVSNVVATKKGIIPAIKIGGKKSTSFFLRVFLDNLSYQNWKENGYELRIQKARVKDTLPNELVSAPTGYYSREHALVLFYGIKILNLSQKNIIAWSKNSKELYCLLLLRKDEIIENEGYFIYYNGSKLKRIKKS